MLFANASPPRRRARPSRPRCRPGVATPVIDATTLTPWLGPERAPPAPLPEIVETDELSDPAFADWLRAAPPPPRWVAAERAFLSRVRRECAVQLARAPNYPEAYGDRRLIRFLRQHKSEKKGVKAVKEYLRWREAEKIDLIRDRLWPARIDRRRGRPVRSSRRGVRSYLVLNNYLTSRVMLYASSSTASGRRTA